MNEQQLDYPAAHSMDTEWFAVDKRGHVAVFETGEAGCVPELAIDPELVRPALNSLPFYCQDLAQNPDGKLYRTPWGTPWNRMAEDAEETPPKARQEYRDVVLWLVDEDAVAEVPGAERLVTSPEVFVRVEQIRGRLLTKLFNYGLALKAWESWIDVQRFGLYSYNHGNEFENWTSGPYTRGLDPITPTTADAMPESLGVQALQYPIEFAATPILQPAEFGNCFGWEVQWIDTAGGVHEFNAHFDV